jgi:hypothetical protein
MSSFADLNITPHTAALCVAPKGDFQSIARVASVLPNVIFRLKFHPVMVCKSSNAGRPKQYAARSRFICNEDGWEEVAGLILEWPPKQDRHPRS